MDNLLIEHGIAVDVCSQTCVSCPTFTSVPTPTVMPAIASEVTGSDISGRSISASARCAASTAALRRSFVWRICGATSYAFTAQNIGRDFSVCHVSDNCYKIRDLCNNNV